MRRVERWWCPTRCPGHPRLAREIIARLLDDAGIGALMEARALVYDACCYYGDEAARAAAARALELFDCGSGSGRNRSRSSQSPGKEHRRSGMYSPFKRLVRFGVQNGFVDLRCVFS